MLKQVNIDQLRVGMYVHMVCGSWFDNPFWTNSFPIQDYADLIKLRASNIRHLWIDTRRGLDIKDNNASKASSSESTVWAAKSFVIDNECLKPTTVTEELRLAAQVVKQSKHLVTTIFSEVSAGQGVNMQRANKVVDELSASVMRNPVALVGLVRLKQADDYTYMHSLAVGALMIALGRQLGLPEHEVHECGIAGLLHDVGKLAVPTEVLNKPGKLTDDEFTLMRAHPSRGHDILMRIGDATPIVFDVCLHHHERMDGMGYPYGLRGDQISVHARMAAICDVYDAITSERAYKPAWDPAVAIGKMAEWTRTGHLDPVIFAGFVKVIGVYPIGTLVRLRSERLAVVVDNSQSLLKPIVSVIFCIPEMAPVPTEVIDLNTVDDGIASRELASDWNLGDLSMFWLPSSPLQHLDLKKS